MVVLLGEWVHSWIDRTTALCWRKRALYVKAFTFGFRFSIGAVLRSAIPPALPCSGSGVRCGTDEPRQLEAFPQKIRCCAVTAQFA
jgi:hypothetical protein